MRKGAGLGNTETHTGPGRFANLNQGMSPMKSNVLPFTPRNTVSEVAATKPATDNVVQLSQFKQQARVRRVATGVFFVTPGSFGSDGATAA